MSDGTNILTFINADTLTPVGILKVTSNGIAQNGLNELEYIKGYIYANVWKTDFIVKINPATGIVESRLDLGVLTSEARNKNPAADVLNGIAYDSINNKIFVTGKLWMNIYEIAFAH